MVSKTLRNDYCVMKPFGDACSGRQSAFQTPRVSTSVSPKPPTIGQSADSKPCRSCEIIQWSTMNLSSSCEVHAGCLGAEPLHTIQHIHDEVESEQIDRYLSNQQHMCARGDSCRRLFHPKRSNAAGMEGKLCILDCRDLKF